MAQLIVRDLPAELVLALKRRATQRKQIAATALIHDLTVVTRNTEHLAPTGVRLRNPFA